MRVLLTLPWFVLIAVADAGYYKIRPPSPPPPPPPSVHYGPHPPPHRYHRPSPHYPPPPPPHYPHHYHHPRSPMSPVKSSSNRHYQRYPLPPPKPIYSPHYSWKNYNTFQAPVVKETFSTPQTTYVPTFFKDEDKGPIHTIPAPNLGPADKPVSLFSPALQEQQDYIQHKKPLHSTNEDLAAVLQHGVTKVNVQYSPGYQVTEDPSLHQPQSGSSSFFAPDPDPEVPALKLPPTTDPHSIPSNGQVPLDLYLQKEAEKTAVHQQQTAVHQQQTASDGSDKLTAQDLFNLLNYDPANPVGLIPQAQLQQHVLQPNIQFYNPLIVPQTGHIDNTQHILAHQPFNIAPQFQTFNYDERTQQGAYGSSSFPLSSMNLHLQGREDYSQGFVNEASDVLEDNDVEGSENVHSYERVSENEIVRTEGRKKTPSSKDSPEVIKNYIENKQMGAGSSSYQTNSVPAQKSEENPKIQESKNQESPSKDSEGRSTMNDQSLSQTSVKPDSNVQLQKSIQIYENTYATNDDLIQQEIKNLNEYGNDYTDEEKIVKGMAIGQQIDSQASADHNKESVAFVDSVPYGSRIRPKRF